MTEIGLSLLLLPLQSAERVDFELEPGVVFFAILFFVLINLLLAAVLYSHLTGSSGEEAATAGQSSEQGTAGVAPSDEKPSEERMDQFVGDIEEGR